MATHQSQPEDKAICLGHPSYIWREGQERRLRIVAQHTDLRDQTILDIGCGLGMYTDAFGRYSSHVFGVEVEHDRAVQAASRAKGVSQAAGEALPFADNTFDVVFSHEVLEHVHSDRQVVCEAVRVTRLAGRVVVFVPNRLWPWETHGFHWRGQYHFGNIPLVNYLPDALRNRLAWHVRAYTVRSLMFLFRGLPVRVLVHRTVFPGFDNVVQRFPRIGAQIRKASYRIEKLPLLNQFGLSHLVVAQKV